MMSCSFVALLSSLLGLAGLAGFGHHYYHHGHGGLGWHGFHRHFGHHEHSIEMQKRCDEGFQIIKCHKQCGDDADCHYSCPLPRCPKMAAKVKGIIQCNMDCGSDFACRNSCNRPVNRFVEMCSSLKKPDFEPSRPAAQFIFSKFQVCQKKCAGDAECMRNCPKPFWMGFQKTCQEAIPIMECHRACGRDHTCHQQCPLPSCPHMKAQVKETLKCHGQCQDHECHQMCPKPMKKILMKCKAFEEAQQCHRTCSDFKCHRECPKARLWKFFGHTAHDFGHRHGFHHHEHHRADFGMIPRPEGLPAPLEMMPMLRGSLPEPELIQCETKCQNDALCLQKCSADWENLQKACTEMNDLMGCHKQCSHDFMCHSKCPRPSIQWLNEKVEASLACHRDCGANDAACHHECPCAFAGLKQKCDILGPTPGSWKMLPPMEVTV